jgi:hypothetical protein
MIFKTKEFNESLTVKELTIGQFLPLMDLMTTEPQQAQQAMMKLSVHLIGVETPIGEGLLEIPAGSFLPLWRVVAEVNNIALQN